MSKAIPISEKAMALTSNIFMNSTTRFIRTGSISTTPNQLQSQSFIPASHSLQKRPQQIKKGIISRKTTERHQEPIVQQENSNNKNPQILVRPNSKSKIQTVQQIAMNMSASIFMNSTTKFVKGLLLNHQVKTQRVVNDIKKQNQKQKISPKARSNPKNPEQVIQRAKSQKKINQTAKKPEVQNLPIAVLTNKRYQPPKNNPNNSIPLKSANITQKQLVKKEQALQTNKKSIEKRQVVKRQPTSNQKPNNKTVSPENDRSSRSPQNNAYKMAGQQFLNSTTQFVKNIQLPAPAQPAVKIESRKGKSSPPAVQRLQTQLSFTPIKSTIGIYSNPDSSMSINSPKRNRLQTDNTARAIPQNAEQTTRKIQRRGSKTRDIRFVQKKQQQPVSILNYNSNKVQNQKVPTSPKAQQVQTKKQVDSVAKKPTVNVQKKEVVKNVASDNYKNVSKPANRYIANFSNNQSRVQEKNQTQLAATKKRPFMRQNANKEINNRKQEILDTTKLDLKNSKSLEQSKQEVGRKEQINTQPNNLLNRQQAKSPRVNQNTISNINHVRQIEIKNNLKKQEISQRVNKFEQEIAVETKKYGPKKVIQQSTLTVLNSPKPKQNKTESYQPKVNSSKSAQVFQNLWSRPSQSKKISTETKIQVDVPVENKGLQKQSQNIKSNPSLFSNNYIKQVNNETTFSKSQKIIPKQTANKLAQNPNRIETNTKNNINEVTNKVQKQKIQSKEQKQIKNQKQKQKQLNTIKLKRSDLIFHSAIKFYVTHIKIVFYEIRRKSISEVRHKKQAIILIHSTSTILEKLRINNLAQAFIAMKKSLLSNTPKTRANEMLKQSAKYQAVTLIFRSLVQKQKHFYKKLVEYSWVKKQIEVTNQSFAKKSDEKSKQINNKKQINNIISILRKYNLNKARIAFNKIVFTAFGTQQTKKNIENLNNNNSPKKTVNYSKSPQKPIRNYAEEKKNLVESKSQIQSQIERFEFRVSEKKRSVQFEREKLIKKMDQLTKKVRKVQTQVSQKRKRSQQLQKLLASLPSSGIQLQIEEGQPKIHQLTQMYSDLLRNSEDAIKIQQFVQKHKIFKQNNTTIVQEWNTLKLNIDLKKQISLWQGYQPKEQKMRSSLKAQQYLQRQLLRGYIRQRYLWEWVHEVASKI